MALDLTLNLTSYLAYAKLEIGWIILPSEVGWNFKCPPDYFLLFFDFHKFGYLATDNHIWEKV